MNRESPSPLWGWLLFGIALVVAVGFRVLDLPIKPLHSDEGVNGWFTLRLFWPAGTFDGVATGYYKYRPSDYHGPFLYFANWVMFKLLGPSDTSLRLGTALTGVAALGVLPLMRREIGLAAVSAAALLIAVQPMDVYFSRTVIHEIYLVTGTLLFVGAGWSWLRRGGTWRALLSAFGLALMFTNKETAILSVACVAAAGGLVLAMLTWTRRPAEETPTRRAVLSAALGRWPDLLGAVVVFWVVMILFFSSFFTHWEGVEGIFTTYTHWFEYGTTGRNQKKEFFYWFQYWPYVWPALVVGLPELVVGLVRRERVTLFLGTWFILSYLVYSAIPYKTPWCLLNVTLPLALLAGCGVARGWRLARTIRFLPAAVVGVWLALLVPLAAVSHEHNFQRYDDDDLHYVYVQTVRDYMRMVDLLLRLDELGGHGGELRFVAIDAKNPVRWYLYTRGWNPSNFRYYKGYPDDEKDWDQWRTDADIFVCRSTHGGRLEREIGTQYHVRTYTYRPGRQVNLYVPDHLWDPTLESP